MTSRLLSFIDLLSRVGQESLLLCGNEWTTKTLLFEFFTILGVEIKVNGVIMVILLSVTLIIINYVAVIPLEKTLVSAINAITRKNK